MDSDVKVSLLALCLTGNQEGAPLDRAALARIIFNDEEKRKVLNGITHRR